MKYPIALKSTIKKNGINDTSISAQRHPELDSGSPGTKEIAGQARNDDYVRNDDDYTRNDDYVRNENVAHGVFRSPLKYAIGLEDIEPGNFKISTWSDLDKRTTFTKCFSKGDVLFGKRRAYLKKVAIAEFNGVCSGDILV